MPSAVLVVQGADADALRPEARLLQPPYADVTVIIPCLDEAATVGGVVEAWRAALPGALVWVVDNGSSDETAARAATAGAMVSSVPERGKGRAVRYALTEVTRPIAVIVDGDATYPADAGLVDALRRTDAVMVVGHRLHTAAPDAFPGPRRLGNLALSALFRVVHGGPSLDLLSGLRALRVDAVRHLPLRAPTFGIEAELTTLALRAGLPLASHPLSYAPRPPGSTSKLRPFRDGWAVLAEILRPRAAPPARD